MAELLLSALIPIVKEKSVDYVLQQFGAMWGIKDDLEKLRRTLLRIQSVLRDAEERQVKEQAVKSWLAVLKDAAYDADDILDEFNYEVLWSKAKIQDDIGNKVRDFFSLHNPFLFRLIMGKNLKDIVERIDRIAAEGDQFGFRSTAQPHTESRTQTHSHVDESRVVGRLEDKEKIVKLLLQQYEKENLTVLPIYGMGGLGKTTLAQLVYGDPRVKNHFQKLIWVCVSEEFNVEKLVKSIIDTATGTKCDLPNMDLLQHRLREELSGKRYLLVMDDVWNEDPVRWDEFKDLLGSSREGSTILVTTRSEQVSRILRTVPPYSLSFLSDDDSWTLFRQRAFTPGAGERPELIEIGEGIVKKCGGLPLAVKALGSLMRTKKEVKDWVDIMKSEIWDIEFGEQRILAVLKLSYNHLPPHLKQCFAFCSIFPKDYEMEKDMLIQLWIANGFIPSEGRKELEVLGEEIFDELVWRSFFQDLRQRAYNYKFDHGYQSAATCKMHDLMHDLATSIMGSECAPLLETGHLEALPDNIRHLFVSGPRQLDIGKTLNKFPTIFTLLLPHTYLDMRTADLSKARSLKVLSLEYTNSIELPVKIRYLKHLRHLDLSGTDIAELPEATSELFNLQVLKLDYCEKLCKLPEAMRNMRSLRHLYIHQCDSLKHMPAGMGQLSSLKTLTKYIVGDDDAERGIRELKGLNLGGHLELYNLEKVRGTEDASEANLGSKQNLQSLALCWGVGVWLTGYYSVEAEDHSFDEEAEKAQNVLAALEPPSGLKMLVVWRYAGLRFPVWMMDRLDLLRNLVEIHLGSCRRCEHLPPLWQLPDLKVLSLCKIDSIKHLQSSGREGTVQPFPSLKHLRLDRMRGLESWWGEEGGDPAPPCFPLLVQIEIRDCPNLTSMPVLPSLRELAIKGNNKIPLESVLSHTTLSCLDIETSGANTSSETRSPSFPQASISSLKHMNSLESLSITGSEELRPLLEREDETRGFSSTLQFLGLNKCNWLFSRQLPSSPLEIWTNLTSLRRLTIRNCDALLFWPEEELQGLISLKSLEVRECQNLTGTSSAPESPSSMERGLAPHLEFIGIIDCKNLMELPKLPASLKSLYIDNCPNMKALTDQLGHLPALKRLYIRKCSGLTSLPQWLRHLTALENLILIECTSLTSLPEGKQGFTTLRRLEIKDCPQLTTLPAARQQRLPSLQILVIKGCPDLERRCKRGGEYWDLVSLLPAPEIGEQSREQPPSFCSSPCLDCFSPV
ncbi:disease resistance protein RGA2-like [Elaeis guineensis]|uniref:Disease resistance protein RGA4 n=1 Tax=Elaeis guineensis var. tenera TaxID=51953 RepID=A0A6I9Q8K0_ELAGV|nr:putative disease resistance protein RGA4 [Elaeis guineensis]